MIFQLYSNKTFEFFFLRTKNCFFFEFRIHDIVNIFITSIIFNKSKNFHDVISFMMNFIDHDFEFDELEDANIFKMCISIQYVFEYSLF